MPLNTHNSKALPIKTPSLYNNRGLDTSIAKKKIESISNISHLSHFLFDAKPTKTNLFNNQHVTLGKPGIDKLSFTIPVDDLTHRGVIRQVMFALLKDGDFKSKGIIITNQKSSNRYRYTYKIVTPKKNDIHIQFKPYKVGINYFRLECNPAKLGYANEINILKILMESLFSYGFNISTVKITRLDICFDIQSPNLLIHVPNFRVGKVIKGHDGSIETQYLGTATSDIEYAVYDKLKELAKDGKPLHQDSPEVLTRVEVRLRKDGCKDLATIAPFKNSSLYCFADLSVCDTHPPKNIKQSDWRFFLNNIQSQGLHATLAQIPEQRLRKKHLDQLAPLKCHFWDKEKVHGLCVAEVIKLQALLNSFATFDINA